MMQALAMTKELLEAHAPAMAEYRETQINTLVEQLNVGIQENFDAGVYRLDVTREDHSVLRDVARVFEDASPYYRVRLHYAQNYITVRWDLKYGPCEDEPDEDEDLDGEDE